MKLPTFPNHRSVGHCWKLAFGHSNRPRESLRTLSLIAFGAVLWLVNWFPLQSPDYLCTATAVVSKERWRELVALSRNPAIDSSRILWIAYQNQHQANATLSIEQTEQPSLHVVKLRIGLDSPSSTTEIDRELERLTRAENLASNGQVIDRQLCKDRWRLQVAEHALTRFRLDREREGVSVDGPETTTPFRLASQSSASSAPLSPLDRSTLDSLRMEIELAKQAVTTTEKGLRKSNAQSAGYIALTGAPRLSALPGAFSWTHLLALLAIGVSIFVGSLRWTHGLMPSMSAGKHWLPSRETQNARSNGRARDPIQTREAQLARSMQRLGIAYWGTIQTTSLAPAAPEVTKDEVIATVHAPGKTRLPARLARCSTIADAMLAAWVVAFMLRYALDAVWRELLFRAPLAAFSSVVFGI